MKPNTQRGSLDSIDHGSRFYPQGGLYGVGKWAYDVLLPFVMSCLFRGARGKESQHFYPFKPSKKE